MTTPPPPEGDGQVWVLVLGQQYVHMCNAHPLSNITYFPKHEEGPMTTLQLSSQGDRL